MADYAEIVAALASKKPPPEMIEALARTNAGLHSFGPPVMGQQPRWTDKKLTAGGWTVTSGPNKGMVVIANPAKIPRENVYGHEGYHARVAESGMAPRRISPSEEPIDLRRSFAYQDLAPRMRAVQPPADQGGPYWGLNASKSPEEQIANIAGYDASLPRGTSILDTEVGQKLFKGNDNARDHYLTQSSVPFGGVWEGQSSEPNVLERAKKIIAEALFRKPRAQPFMEPR